MREAMAISKANSSTTDKGSSGYGSTMTPPGSNNSIEANANNTNGQQACFQDMVKQANVACQHGNYENAIQLYTDAIQLSPGSHVLFSNRSAAFVKTGQFTKALQDAIKAKEINPEWAKAYYREGVALQCLGRHAEALGTFSAGLAVEPKSVQLLASLIEAAIKSPLKAALEPTFQQIQAMKLDKSPFVMISVIGQELLAQGKYNTAVQVLESALKIGTCSLKLRGSVFSALSSAYWALNNVDKAISYMQQDLVVAKQLSDVAGECRAHGNLGSAYYRKGNFKEALTSHRYQLVLAMKSKDTQAAASALTSLGHVYTEIGDHPNALASHKQCLELVRSHTDRLQEARELGNVGSVYLSMGEYDQAVECHTQHLCIASELDNKVEQARAYTNLGSAHHYKRNFEQAVLCHDQVLKLAQDLKDRSIESRAYAGLGHAARCMGHYQQAKTWYEKQLEVALATKDKVSEGRACSNLGIVFHLFGDHDAALKLHQAHLNIARSLHDKAGMGKAFGNIGNAYYASGYYEQAIKYHKQELTISKEVNDRSCEASTHGNLAVAYQALGMHEMALVHYHAHLNLARETKDTLAEALALCNLGNCHSSRNEFVQAIPFYENYLMLSQDLKDNEGEAKALHYLAYAHYCLGNHKEAIRFYEQDLALAKENENRFNMGRAYCNLGLAHLALGNFEEALNCQKDFLAIAQIMKHNQAKFRALGNIGDVLVKKSSSESLSEAAEVFSKQLMLAKQMRDRGCEAGAFGSLGVCHRMARKYDKALAFHTQELSLLQDLGDLRGECRAHGNLGAVHLSLGNYINAAKCYQEQLDRARDIRGEPILEAQAHGNLGIAKMSLGHHEEAIGCFEQQLALIEQQLSSISPPSLLLEKGRAYGNLGSCYDALADHDEAVRCLDQYLAISLKLNAAKDQDRAYRELGLAHKNLGNLQQALVCFEKRLVAAHDLVHPDAKGSAYGELGEIHALLGNYEQAISCIDRQISAARENGDRVAEAQAASSLGKVYEQMEDWTSALKYHNIDLHLSEETRCESDKARAMSNLGSTYEGMGDLAKALEWFEQNLQVATGYSDPVAKTKALMCLGRINHTLGNIATAIGYLEQGLVLAEQSGRREDEARIRHQLGIAFWREEKDLETAKYHLNLAASLLETIRREAKGTPDYRLSLFDLQTECYHALQRILVKLCRENEALVVAERAKTRAFVDLLLERQQGATRVINRLHENAPTSINDIINLVNRQKASVLYYSIAAGYLHIWLIVPTKGVVKFHEFQLDASDGEDLSSRIQDIHESLGIATGATDARDDDADEEATFHKSTNHLNALGDKLNQDRTGFLRMVNRSSKLNASSYSLSSLFSVGSVNAGSIMTSASSRHGSTRSKRHFWQGPTGMKKLYQLLIEPLEDDLPEGYPCELVLVLEGDLYLVPFPMMKGPNCTETLCERYSIIIAPSLTSIKNAKNRSTKNLGSDKSKTSCLIVGNPKIPEPLRERWDWEDIPYAAQEADTIKEILQADEETSVLKGDTATKEAVLRRITNAEVVHFACHVSWKLSALVLSPGEVMDAKKRYSITSDTIHEHSDEDIARAEIGSTSSLLDNMPSLSEFLLTAADVLNLKLNAKLIVISSAHSSNCDSSRYSSSDGLIALSRAFLAAGAQCVLLSLWPVPNTAVKVVMKAFYSAMLQGSRASRALSDAMITAQNTKQMQHPTNWAGFVLIGSDIKLSNKVAMMGQALRDILSTPDSCRDALRVTLHLVEKSLQRIHRGNKNAMYTSQKSIENKVGDVNGWRDLLISVGFRFEPSTNGIPPSVFFPQNDPGERLTQCSASLQAILGLNKNSWEALAKLLRSPDEADEIIALFRQVSVSLSSSDGDGSSVKVPVNVRVWRIPGCHELLASLGFDLLDVGKEEVVLKTGKGASKRQIQFALQSLLALFDTQDAPRCVDVDDTDDEEFDDDCVVEDPDSEETSASDLEPPFPTPRKSDIILDGQSGAFTSYVKNRGEPDGRHGDSPPHPAFPQTTVPPPPPPFASMAYTNIYQNYTKGHESDCNFTPSPVDPILPKAHRTMHHHHHNGPFTYGMQRSSVNGDFSNSSQSSAEWDSSSTRRVGGLHPHLQSKLNKALNEIQEATGGYTKKYPVYENSNSVQFSSRQPAGRPVVPVRSVFTDVGYGTTQKITDTSDPNDKFSVRAETFKTGGKNHHLSPPSGVSLRQNPYIKEKVDSRLNPGVIKRIPPTGESDSPENTLNTKRSSLSGGLSAETASIATNSSANTFIVKSDDGKAEVKNDLSQIDLHGIRPSHIRKRENPLTELYHDRSKVGLGLAPPLSSLIMTSNLQVVQVDHHSDSEGSNSRNTSSMHLSSVEESFNRIDTLSPSSMMTVPQPPPPQTLMKPRPPVPPKPSISSDVRMPRDEGDGRSMTDSQYSGYSPNGHVQSRHSINNVSTGDVSKRMNFLKMQDYMNEEEITVLEENEEKEIPKPQYRAHPPPMKCTPNPKMQQVYTNGGETKHPQQIWRRDQNGALHYTGMFSSDC